MPPRHRWGEYAVYMNRLISIFRIVCRAGPGEMDPGGPVQRTTRPFRNDRSGCRVSPKTGPEQIALTEDHRVTYFRTKQERFVVLKPTKPPPMNAEQPAQSPDSAPPPPALTVPQHPERMAFFGPPPLLEGEDTEAYGDLLARVSAAIRPNGILEEIWLRDFLDLAWEALRWRRLKAALVNGAVSKGLPGSSVEGAYARALAFRLDEIERIDRMIASAEARRNGVLREIERHRATLGQELRRLVPHAEDAEFEVVESPPAAAGVM